MFRIGIRNTTPSHCPASPSWRTTRGPGWQSTRESRRTGSRGAPVWGRESRGARGRSERRLPEWAGLHVLQLLWDQWPGVTRSVSWCVKRPRGASVTAALTPAAATSWTPWWGANRRRWPFTRTLACYKGHLKIVRFLPEASADQVTIFKLSTIQTRCKTFTLPGAQNWRDAHSSHRWPFRVYEADGGQWGTGGLKEN